MQNSNGRFLFLGILIIMVSGCDTNKAKQLKIESHEISYSQPMKDSVLFDYQIVLGNDMRITFIGTTNLPDGTKLSASIKGESTNFMGASEVFVKNGNFKESGFGPKSGFQPGQYTADVTMESPTLQTKEVLSIIGLNGKCLRGNSVYFDSSFEENSVSLSKPFEIRPNGKIVFKINKAAIASSMQNVKSILSSVKSLENRVRVYKNTANLDDPACMNIMNSFVKLSDSLKNESDRLPLEYSMQLKLAAMEISLCANCSNYQPFAHCDQAKKSIEELEKYLQENSSFK